MTIKSIACLHTVLDVSAFIAEKFEEQTRCLDIRIQHEVYPEYLEALSAKGEQLDALYRQFSNQIDSLLTSNDAILVTCSSLGNFADKYKQTCPSPVFRIDVSPQDISSTKIRRLIQKGLPIQSLVPEKVEAFIKIKGLYL